MSEGKPSKTENNVEQKHMFSAWEKCVQEVEENKDDPRFKLEFDINGSLLAPNGQISEYNKYRQKDNEGKYIKPENENDDPALLLSKVVRTKIFIEGEEGSEWEGFGDWIGRDFFSNVVNTKTNEPIFVFHGTTFNIPAKEGLMPKSFMDFNLKEMVFFSSISSLAYKFGLRMDLSKENTSNFPVIISIKRPYRAWNHKSLVFRILRDGWGLGRLEPRYDGFIQDGDVNFDNHDGFGDQYAVFKKSQIFQLPFSLAEHKPVI